MNTHALWETATTRQTSPSKKSSQLAHTFIATHAHGHTLKIRSFDGAGVAALHSHHRS